MRELLPRLLGDRDVDIRILSCELARTLPEPGGHDTALHAAGRRTGGQCLRGRDRCSRGGGRPRGASGPCRLRAEVSRTPFLAFAIRTATDRINSQHPASRA